MKKFVILLFSLFLLMFLNSCEEVQESTSFEITVKDDLGNIVSGATVKLYLEYSDLQNGIDQIGVTKTTDANGKVIFNDLHPIKYYCFAESDCLNNYNGGITIVDPLTENVNNTMTTIVASTGTLWFENNSTNPYEVYINGSYEFDAAGGETSYSYYRPTGSYSIRVLQKSGYLIYPTDETYTGTLECGETLTVSFP